VEISLFGVVIVLLVLPCGAWLCLVIAKRRGFRFQFSLRSLLAVTAVVALLLGWISARPRPILAVTVPRIEAKPDLTIDLTHQACVLDISRRLGRTVLDVTPCGGFDAASRAELFWLDSGTIRHVAIADKGRVAAATFSAPNQWPLLIGVIEYHPQAVHVVARWILSGGRNGGANGLHEANDSTFDGGIDQWGKNFLERAAKPVAKAALPNKKGTPR
jgi:hypothetical protein